MRLILSTPCATGKKWGMYSNRSSLWSRLAAAVEVVSSHSRGGGCELSQPRRRLRTSRSASFAPRGGAVTIVECVVIRCSRSDCADDHHLGFKHWVSVDEGQSHMESSSTAIAIAIAIATTTAIETVIGTAIEAAIAPIIRPNFGSNSAKIHPQLDVASARLG